MTWSSRLAEKAITNHMVRLSCGQLTVHHAGATEVYGPGENGPVAEIVVHDPAFFRSLLLGGHIGAAESYVRGEWTTEDLTAVVRLLSRNRETLDGLETGWARLSQPVLALLRFWNRNTRSGSARNIRAHYDLGNDFFASFLDDTLTYSSGIFVDDRSSMRDASIAKYDRLCRELEIESSDHVIEIGSGWGGFAIHAASRYGCRVTTTTISGEQFQLAGERVAQAGLEDKVTVLLKDYRDLEGTYDKLVSIEMIEAVGHQFLETYFAKVASLLKPDGLAAIQAITVRDDWYDPRQRQVDFIKRYIFPGSFIPSVSALTMAAAGTDMRLIGLKDHAAHYAETLFRWRQRFDENWDEIRKMGFDEEFRRLWEFYFCYCEGGFAEAILGSAQLICAKPLARKNLASSGQGALALDRSALYAS